MLFTPTTYQLLTPIVFHFLQHPVILVNLVYKRIFMTEIVIDKKKYVLIPEKDYQALQKKPRLKKHLPLMKHVHIAKN
jgi:hypothetical protein